MPPCWIVCVLDLFNKKYFPASGASVHNLYIMMPHTLRKKPYIKRHIRTCGEEICGRSTGKKKPGLENWWWKEENEKAVKEKKDRLKIWKRTSAESDRKEYKLAKSTAKKVVARVKAEAIDGLYDNMETSEGQKDVYRIAAARDRAGRDIGQIRTIKSATGEVLMKDEFIRERWGQYFSWAMIEENPRVETEDRAPNQGITSPVGEAEREREHWEG